MHAAVNAQGSLAKILKSNGVSATYYNAGLEDAVRDARQKALAGRQGQGDGGYKRFRHGH